MAEREPRKPRRRRFDPGDMTGVGLMSTVGLTLVICSVIGFGIGYWVDNHWTTDPWGKVVGFLFGTAAGFVEMFKTMMKVNKDD